MARERSLAILLSSILLWGFLMDDHIIFIAIKGHYTPAVGEPSPFGPDVKLMKDNPWVIWKRNQPGYNEEREGSPTLLREALITQLKAEKPRVMVQRGNYSPYPSTPTGDVALAALLWEKDHLNIPLEQAHEQLANKLRRWEQHDERVDGRPV
jgi:hypothetical protein